MNYFEKNLQYQNIIKSVSQPEQSLPTANIMESDNTAFGLVAALALTFLISIKLDKKMPLDEKTFLDTKTEEILNKLYKKAVSTLSYPERDNLIAQLTKCKDYSEKKSVLNKVIVNFDCNGNERDNISRENRASKYYGNRID